MHWKKVEITPDEGDSYVVLCLQTYAGTEVWKETWGRYLDGKWQCWYDGEGWYDDKDNEVKYYLKLPEFPSLPSSPPMCEYFCYNFCVLDKHVPRCACKGNPYNCDFL